MTLDLMPPLSCGESAPLLALTAITTLAPDPMQARVYRNFLILAPSADGVPHDTRIEAMARLLTPEGYVYVARTGQKSMEDDSFGIRYLPLRDMLPCFGEVSGVIVVDDETLAETAAINYPEAPIALVKLPRISQDARQEAA